jgi:osmoprotectant transport system permease protein
MTAVTDRSSNDARQSSALRKAVRYLSMPAFLTMTLVALYAWVNGQTLDSIESRALTWTRIQSLTLEHLEVSAISAALVVLLAVPTGILCTRPWARRIRPVAIGLANAGQSIPSLGLITLLVLLLAVLLPGRWAVIAGLVAYAFLPILRNTIAGIESVDATLIEAARGMGMNSTQILRRIELPLSVPIVLAGIRVALILTVGTATLAFLFPGVGALGQGIQQGFQLQRPPVLITYAVIAAALALLVDYLAGIAEDVLKPRGL